MSRTNIDLDDEAVADVMRRYHFATKREAVNYALNRVRRRPASLDEALALRGAGWDGPTADELRPAIEDFEVSAPRLAQIEEFGER